MFSKTFNGSVFNNDFGKGTDGIDLMSGRCMCDMKPVDCEPSDGWEVKIKV